MTHNINANISNNTQQQQIALPTANNVSQPIDSLKFALSLLETSIDDMRSRYPSTYNRSKHYLSLSQQHQLISEAIAEIGFLANHAELRILSERINKVKERDPEIKGCVIRLEFGTSVHNHYAHIHIAPHISDVELQMLHDEALFTPLHTIRAHERQKRLNRGLITDRFADNLVR